MSLQTVQNHIDLFNDYSEKYIPVIDRSIIKFFIDKVRDSEFPFMSEMYSYLKEYCTRKGKRVRPLMLLIGYEGYKHGPKNIAEIIKLSSVVEIMHSFLLIQDDIIDNSDLRRGEKSLHLLLQDAYKNVSYNKNIGNDIAIILADILFANSLEIISKSKIKLKVKNRFLSIFSDTYEMTAWGQVLDIYASLPKKIDHLNDAPMQISTLKTAYYTIYYPMLMGYILTGRNSKKEKKIIKDFSFPLGLAFQIRDDILGVFGKEETTGKPSDSDLVEGKMTLLIQNTIDNLHGNEKKQFIDLFVKKDKSQSNIDNIRSIIEDSGALKITKEKHSELINKSLTELQFLNFKNKYKNLLRGIIDLISKIDDL